MNSINSFEAQELIKNGAILVDIREKNEFLAENIIGAINVPLSEIGQSKGFVNNAVVFTCRSGMRTQSNAAMLVKIPAKSSFLLEGGVNAWKIAGFDTEVNKSAPIDMFRQVQIIAGSLVVLGTILGLFVHINFSLLALFVGTGLIFSGISGWCGMAKALKLLPYNKVA